MGRYTRYSATATATVDVPFSCKYCGFSAPMQVTEKATASRQVGGWGHSQDVAQREWALAQQSAHKSATSSAKDTAKLVPCKQCGKRDAAAVRNHVIFTVVSSLIALGIAGALAYCVVDVAESTRGQAWLSIFAFIMLIVSGALAHGGYTKHRDAPTKARFVDGSPPLVPQPPTDPQQLAAQRALASQYGQQPVQYAAPQAPYAPPQAQYAPPQAQYARPQAQYAPQQAQYANAPPGQVMVHGPDGRQYPGVVVARAQGHVQVTFPNGSTSWVPEGGVIWPRA